MRISDWSSDVCSSDLLVGFPARLDVALQQCVGQELEKMAGLGEVMRGRRCEPLIMRHHRKHDELEALLFDVAEGRARQLIEKMGRDAPRSEEHTSELQSLMRISYAVFCLKKKKQT